VVTPETPFATDEDRGTVGEHRLTGLHEDRNDLRHGKGAFALVEHVGDPAGLGDRAAGGNRGVEHDFVLAVENLSQVDLEPLDHGHAHHHRELRDRGIRG
jgi:hypothetical protein